MGTPPEPVPTPGWGARIRVTGYLLLWLSDGVVQGLHLGLFLLGRKRIRRRFHALILERPAAGDAEPGTRE